MNTHRTAALAISWIALLLSAPAAAQYRATSDRARMELSFDHGFGFSTEGEYIELAADLRLWSPDGLGAVLRAGGAVQGFSNAFAADVGIGYRFDLVASPYAGLQLAGAIGPSVAWGPFDRGDVTAFGGWAMVHLDFWHRRFFVGLGVSAHAMLTETSGQPDGRDAPLLTLTPLIRIGGDWGL